MTKRLASKHKVDRRLKVNLWGRPKSPFNSEIIHPANTAKQKKENFQIMVRNLKLNKK